MELEGGTLLLATIATAALVAIACQLWVANTPIREQKKAEEDTATGNLVESQIAHLRGQKVEVSLKNEAMLLDDNVGCDIIDGGLRGVLADADDKWAAIETGRNGIVKLVRIDKIARLTGLQR